MKEEEEKLQKKNTTTLSILLSQKKKIRCNSVTFKRENEITKRGKSVTDPFYPQSPNVSQHESF